MARDNDIDKGKWAAGDFASWMLENAVGQAIARPRSDCFPILGDPEDPDPEYVF